MTLPDATAAHIAGDGRPPASSGASRAKSGRFDFLDPPRAPDELGWLAHYRVRRLLGEGGMGLVFEAEDADLLRPVALKVIRPELAGSPQAAQRFLLEARAMAALKHDHIVTIYQVGRERGIPFLAMEYLRGISLYRWLDRGHRPAVDLLLRLGREIADGLAAAHRRGVVHRDIKPANLWLEAPIGRVKILDFGLARAEGQDVYITNPGTTVGSPAYMAPELAHGERGDPACDLFSLGCVLYLLGTGRLPFPGTSVVAVLTALTTETPPPPRATDPAIPPSLDDLIMRLLAKRPSDRPASATEVVEAIRAIEHELQAQRHGAELSPDPPPLAITDPARRAPDGIAGEPGGPGDPARTRRRRTLGIAAAAVLLAIVAIPMMIYLRPRGARSIAPDRRLPEVVAVPGPREAVPQPAPPPTPTVAIAPPGPAKPPAEATPAPDEGPRMAAPGVAPPRPEGPLEPEIKEAARRVERLWDRERILDPDDDCRILLDKANDRASILVPGVAHLLSAEIDRMNAPRIVREVTGDFEVRVRVTGIDSPGSRASTSRYAPFHGAGILLSSDADDYIRLEIAADHRKSGTFAYANLEHRQDGHLVTSWGLKIEDGSTYLRLRRLGDEVRAAFSPDGERWTSFAPLIAKLPDRVEIGVAAINSATKPLEAHFEGFRLTAGPGAGSEVNADGIRSKPTAPPVETGRDP